MKEISQTPKRSHGSESVPVWTGRVTGGKQERETQGGHFGSVGQFPNSSSSFRWELFFSKKELLFLKRGCFIYWYYIILKIVIKVSFLKQLWLVEENRWEKKRQTSQAGWFSWSIIPCTKGVTDPIPGQGTHLGCGFDPQSRRVREATY